MSVDNDIVNFAINNELRECNEYRLEHLNVEEVECLKKVLYEYRDIQCKEGENLTFTSTIKHVIQTQHEDPVYRKRQQTNYRCDITRDYSQTKSQVGSRLQESK